tara:strand:+ start:705 stop:1208 length:504 start_codon:yes stop_codon:yes gene_type:complete
MRLKGIEREQAIEDIIADVEEQVGKLFATPSNELLNRLFVEAVNVLFEFDHIDNKEANRLVQEARTAYTLKKGRKPQTDTSYIQEQVYFERMQVAHDIILRDNLRGRSEYIEKLVLMDFTREYNRANGTNYTERDIAKYMLWRDDDSWGKDDTIEKKRKRTKRNIEI